MKLLLTSGGLRNATLVRELESLAGRPTSELVVAYIPTASRKTVRGKAYIFQKLQELRKRGFKEVITVDIAKSPKSTWLPLLENSDVIYVLGGNTTYLMESFNASGLTEEIPRLLENKVYVGVSAGSYIATPDTRLNSDGVDTILAGLRLVEFGLQAHLNNQQFALAKDEATTRKRVSGCPYTVYALDDAMAVKVDGGKTDIVGEGTYIVIEPGSAA